MKTLTRLTLILAAMIPLAIYGQDATVTVGPKLLVAKRNVNANKVTFLGVRTTAATDTLRKQVGLPNGVGLAVTHVTPGSPGGAAGLLKHDVIKLVDEQIIINGEQFGTLIRNYKPSDTVKLTIIREGKEKVIEATLGETTRDAFGLRPFPGRRKWLKFDELDEAVELPLFVAPGALGKGNDEEIKKALKLLGEKMKAENLPEGMEDALKKLEEEIKKGLPGSKVHMRILKDNDAFGKMKAYSTFSDNKHQMTTWTDENGKQLKVTDKEGKLVFEGPINDEEQLKAVPEEIRNKLKGMTVKIKVFEMKDGKGWGKKGWGKKEEAQQL